MHTRCAPCAWSARSRLAPRAIHAAPPCPPPQAAEQRAAEAQRDAEAIERLWQRDDQLRALILTEQTAAAVSHWQELQQKLDQRTQELEEQLEQLAQQLEQSREEQEQRARQLQQRIEDQEQRVEQLEQQNAAAFEQLRQQLTADLEEILQSIDAFQEKVRTRIKAVVAAGLLALAAIALCAASF